MTITTTSPKSNVCRMGLTKVTEKDLKSRLRATESLAAKAQSQPQGQPSNRIEKVAENLTFKAQIQPPAKTNEYIAHFDHEITNLQEKAYVVGKD